MLRSNFFENEEGMALVVVLMVSVVLLTSLLAGYTILDNALKTSSIEISRDQVISVALAGLEDALSWFRSTTYGKPPVKTTFDPLNAGQTRGTTPVLIPETDNSSIGIVRDFPIGLNNRLFGHYEVRNTSVQDITRQRLPSSNANGLIWRIEVNAAIYKQNNASVSYNQNPNQVLRTVTMGAEVRRMALTPPQATLTTYRASNIQIQNRGEVRNDTGTAIMSRQGPGNFPNGLLIGTPQQTVLSSDQQFIGVVDPLTVFGMTLSELKAFVQNNPNGIYVNNSSDFNSKLVPYPSNSANPPMVYIEGSAGFATATIQLYNTNTNAPLNTFGVLVVDGLNVDILGGPSGCISNNCGQFTGLVYVRGGLRIDNGAVISGAVIACHRVQGCLDSESIQIGSSNPGSPLTRLLYNGSYISSVLNQTMGNYAISKALHILN